MKDKNSKYTKRAIVESADNDLDRILADLLIKEKEQISIQTFQKRKQQFLDTKK